MKIIKVKKDKTCKRIYFCGIEIFKKKQINFREKYYLIGI